MGMPANNFEQRSPSAQDRAEGLLLFAGTVCRMVGMSIRMPTAEEIAAYEGQHRRRAELYVPPDLEEAADAWGANCGPGALAALFSRPLAQVKDLLPGWPGYTNPTHMLRALDSANWYYDDRLEDFQGRGLAFVQWVGPWDQPGKQRWAYRYTHWIGFCQCGSGETAVYDVNNGCGWCWFDDWAREIAPLLFPKRATGYRIRKYIGAWPGDAEA